MIRRNRAYNEKGLIVGPTSVIVRSNLAYCIQACILYYRKGIDTLEKYKGEQLNSFHGLEILATKKD